MTEAKLLVVLGTRPEAIKLAPVIRAARAAGLEPIVASTGQHREMLEQMLVQFDISPDVELAVMQERQSLAGLTSRLTEGLDDVLAQCKPDAVVVQGDTTTALVGALTAFYRQVPVAHVEAGLRSGSLSNPFPEEANRRLVGQLARWHFAPTCRARDNLTREGVPPDAVEITGNTGIDNMLWARRTGHGSSAFTTSRRKVLVTLHRRENQGATMVGIVESLQRLAARGDVEIVLPVHLSPAVREVVLPGLRDEASVRLVEPLDYFDFSATMAASDLILSDSGGVQEEAPTLGKPVLVLRENTERPEAIEAGVARLAGVDPDAIYKLAAELLDDERAYSSMARAVNPFGDGHAAPRVVARILEDLGRQ